MNLSICRKLNDRHSDRGFTLVEVIVVLAVIAIISSAAVLSITGYIDKARFDKNEQNAQSVFQAAQASISRKKTSGEIESWVKDVLMQDGKEDPYYPTNSDMNEEGAALDELFNPVDFSNFDAASNNPGESVHMRYVLTYRKGGTDAESRDIEKLLSGYFYDTTVMQATFSIEFDVEQTIDSDGERHYYANAYAVFYDEGRSDWDAKAMKNPDCKVPFRDSGYRRRTSLVGYYNGGVPGAVDSVYVPNMDKKIEFAELALKNGEELELSFSAINGNTMVTGSGLYNVHYTASVYDRATDVKLADLVISEAALTKGIPTKNKPIDYSSALKFEAGTKNDGDTEVHKVDGIDRQILYTIENLTDKNGDAITRFAATMESFALVYLHQGSGDFDYDSLTYGELSGDSDFYCFPLRISYVINKDTNGNATSYVAYSIALDSMMSRDAVLRAEKDIAGTGSKGLNYSISRLFEDTEGFNKNLAPKNIYVSMTAAADSFTDPHLAECNVTGDLPGSDAVKAIRALDDPVYLQADGSYKVSEHAADKDSSEGFAVVNTYFGDLSAGSMGSNETEGTATITSFRHLYNIRFMEGFTGDVEYSVKRDLNWYSEENGIFTSDVKVYGIKSGKTYLDYESPVGKNSDNTTELKLVVWPALSKLPAKQKIIAAENALSSAQDNTSVIRNVQMRRKSFLSTDPGLGFICVNKGTLQNIRCENFILMLDDTTDGMESDIADAATAVSYLKANGNETKSSRPLGGDGKVLGQVPVGGLVGLNDGTLGSTGVEDEKNKISMKNGIVMTGEYSEGRWILFNRFDSAGGLIGKYSQTASSNGSISVTGRSVVSGYANVGGIIGDAYGGIGAYLVADSTSDGEASVELSGIDSLVMGRQQVGGAVGYISGGYLSQDVSAPEYSCNSEGVVNIDELSDAKYGVSVNLTENSYVWQYGNEQSKGVGGAVGLIDSHTADKILSVRSVNAGYILTGNSNNGKNAGGAIGCLNGGAAARMYISTENSGNIGTLNGTDAYGKSYAAAGGVALLSGFGTDSDIYVINSINSGRIYCNTNGTDKDAGIGISVGSSLMDGPYPSFYIKAVNLGTVAGSDNRGGQANDNMWKSGTVCNYGVGGAVGYMNGLKNSHIYAELKSGSVLTANGNNLGGAVGCLRKNTKGKSLNDPLTVTAVLNEGVTVRSTGINVGGCVGNIWEQGDNSVLRTKIMGNAEVAGYKNVGGVAGRGQQSGNATEAYMYLQGTSQAPTLKIIASTDGSYNDNNINAGGLIGVAGCREGNYSTELKSPKQDGTDDLILDIDAQRAVGGIAGCFYLRDLENTNREFNCLTPVFDIRLNPASSVNAVKEYAGGAFGYLGDNKWQFNNGNSSGRFSSGIKVNIPAGATAPVITGLRNIGGDIGTITLNYIDGNIEAYIGSPEAITAVEKSAGGTVGYMSINKSAASFKAVLAADGAVYAEKESGGCVGCIGGSGTYGKLTAVLGNEDGVSAVSPLRGRDSIGGCVGWITNNAVIDEAVTIVNTSANIFKFRNETDNRYNIGGVIGKLNQNTIINSCILKGNSPEMILFADAENVGGLVGYSESTGGVFSFREDTDVRISGKCAIGGYFGNFRNGTMGTAGSKTVINNVRYLLSSVNKGIGGAGTGPVAGLIDGGALVFGDFEVTLKEGDIVTGYWNTSGAIGRIGKGSVYGNISVHLAGGQIIGHAGTAAGVLGSIYEGEIPGMMETFIEYGYSTTDVAGLAISSGNNEAVGGVIAQIGSTDVNGRKTVVKLGTLALRLKEDFAIMTGSNAVGGVIGRAETAAGTIQAAGVKSADGNKHKLYIQTGAYDVGGVMGYMNSELNDYITVENTDMYVKGKYGIGGWIGCLDGAVGIDKKGKWLSVNGVKEVLATSYGAGGVIGTLGLYNSTARVYYNLEVNLEDALIESNGSNNDGQGAGGAMGCVDSDAKGNDSNLHAASFYGDITVNLANTTITSNKSAGGIFGYVGKDAVMDDDCVFKLYVTGNNQIKCSSGSGYAGGLVGANRGHFLGDTEINVDDSAEYKVSAPKGYVGGIMGKNESVFGKKKDYSLDVPVGGGSFILEATGG